MSTIVSLMSFKYLQLLEAISIERRPLTYLRAAIGTRMRIDWADTLRRFHSVSSYEYEDRPDDLALYPDGQVPLTARTCMLARLLMMNHLLSIAEVRFHYFIIQFLNVLAAAGIMQICRLNCPERTDLNLTDQINFED